MLSETESTRGRHVRAAFRSGLPVDKPSHGNSRGSPRTGGCEDESGAAAAQGSVAGRANDGKVGVGRRRESSPRQPARQSAWQRSSGRSRPCPRCETSLFQPDPYVALVDAWVLLYQMGDYFESGPGKIKLGPASERAAMTCRTSEDHLAGVAASATTSGDVSRVRDFVRKWAADHPITGAIAARQPMLGIDVANQLPDSLTVGQAAAEIAISIDDLNRRLDAVQRTDAPSSGLGAREADESHVR